MPRTARKPASLRFRRFTSSDLAAVARLNAQAGFNFDRESEARKYYDEGFYPEQIVLAEIGGEVVGKMDLVEGASSRGRFLLISRLVVAEPWRGRGVGSRLLDYAVAEAKRRRCDTLDLYVSVRNPRALALYAANGFAQKDVDIHMQRAVRRKRVTRN